MSGDDSESRVPTKRFARPELQSRSGMVRAVEADQDSEIMGARISGRDVFVLREPSAGVTQILGDGDNPGAKAPSFGSSMPSVSTLCRNALERDSLTEREVSAPSERHCPGG